MIKKENRIRFCPYCKQQEVAFKKVYKEGNTLLHSPNRFYLCQNPKCIYFIPIKVGKLIKPVFDRPFYYLKEGGLW